MNPSISSVVSHSLPALDNSIGIRFFFARGWRKSFAQR